MLTAERTLPWDWHPGTVPENVVVDDGAYIETSFSFHLYRSRRDTGVRYGRGAATYLGTMFDLGPDASVTLGEYALVHGARIISDAAIEVGDHALISWNVVLMDTYRFSRDPLLRRAELRNVPAGAPRVLAGAADARPITIEPNVWIGFDAVVLPGVRIGRGAIVGARSVVMTDVPPYTVVAGNPAVPIRTLDADDVSPVVP